MLSSGMGVYMRIILMTLVALAASPAMADDGAINLICPGAAAKDESNTSIGLFGGTVGSVTTESRISFEDSLGIKLSADNTGVGRIPKRIQPAYKSGGEDGWFPLYKVKRSEDEITGQIRFHSMYKPRFRLDRITGSVTLTGSLGDFAGQCQAYDPATVERKF